MPRKQKTEKKTALPMTIEAGTVVRIVDVAAHDRFASRTTCGGDVLPDVRAGFVGLVGTVLSVHETAGDSWSLRHREVMNGKAYYSGGVRFAESDVGTVGPHIAMRGRIHHRGPDAEKLAQRDAHFDYVSVEIVSEAPKTTTKKTTRKPRATKETKESTGRKTRKAAAEDKPARGKRTKKGS